MTLADTPEMTESRENVTARQLERDDDLIWCPSQCHANVIAPNGTKAVLYLRWRHADPWQASIVVGFHEGDGVRHPTRMSEAFSVGPSKATGTT